MEYPEFFQRATGREPFPFQSRLAAQPWPEVLEVPTGLGKTAAVTLAWLWKRRGLPSPNFQTPRRLVYCLPMRVLVEQTAREIRNWLERLGLHGEAGEGKVSVHLLLGGADDTDTWAAHPEEDMILVGTQDMLLSRALMRGYGISRYLWPIHFAFLHNDAFWVFDEIQLMGAGLPTSAQLDAFRRQLPMGKSSRTLWMSATLRPEWLATVDLRPHLNGLVPFRLTEEERNHEAVRTRREAVKRLSPAATHLPKGGAKTYGATLAGEILSRHRPGANTLVVLNTVDRAQDVFQALGRQAPGIPRLLVHARFREGERTQLNAALNNTPPENGRLIVATQAVEAGVDISSRVLFTELAPWAPLVQRFGRCNRYGEWNDEGGAEIYWVDIEADAAPYGAESLAVSRACLDGLAGASPADLPPVEEEAPLHPVLRRKDFLELFNTDPDLTGFDTDVSPYIRDADDLDVQVFWRDFSLDPATQPPPTRAELCRASLSQFKRYTEHKLRKGEALPRRWDSLAEEWRPFREAPRPGQVLMLDSRLGGYTPELGFAPESGLPVPILSAPEEEQAERYGGDHRSVQARPVPLDTHLLDVEDEARQLAAALELPPAETQILGTAGRRHDVGKAHPVFQGTLHGCSPEEAMGLPLLAKSAIGGKHSRPHFRHELASALAWLQNHGAGPDADLVAYLIAAHHGKVRLSLRALPDETPPDAGQRFARGIWEGDVLPGFAIGDRDAVPPTVLMLDLMELGESESGPSWAARTAALAKTHGPFRLAWLEALLRIADWRASAKENKA